MGNVTSVLLVIMISSTNANIEVILKSPKECLQTSTNRPVEYGKEWFEVFTVPYSADVVIIVRNTVTKEEYEVLHNNYRAIDGDGVHTRYPVVWYRLPGTAGKFMGLIPTNYHEQLHTLTVELDTPNFYVSAKRVVTKNETMSLVRLVVMCLIVLFFFSLVSFVALQ